MKQRLEALLVRLKRQRQVSGDAKADALQAGRVYKYIQADAEIETLWPIINELQSIIQQMP